jgi:hypothetical protein
MPTSKETTERQIEVAREQGAALQRAIDAMRKDTGGNAGLTRAGDYEIGYAVEDAERLYRWRDGEVGMAEPD